MLSRRPVEVQSRGRIGSPLAGGTPVPPVDPLYTLVTGATVLAAWRTSDVIESGGTVSQITDLVGTLHFTQAGGAALEGIYNASDGPGGRPTVSGDGAGRYLSCAFNPGLPGTTPIYRYSIWRLNAWTSGRVLWGSATLGETALVCVTSTPLVAMRNNTIVTAKTMTLGTWFRVIELYAGGVGTDKFRIGSDESTGLTAGNQDPDAPFGLFAEGDAASPCNASFVEGFVCNAEPSNVAAIDAQVTSYYAGEVSV